MSQQKNTIQLKSVIIRGFRSIESADINLKEKEPLILVGKNDSGKSNILKAFKFLGGEENNFKSIDKKMMSESDDFYVDFYCDVDDSYLSEKLKVIIEKAIHNNKKDLVFSNKNNLDYCVSRLKKIECTFHVDQDQKQFYCENLGDAINSGWYELVSTVFNTHYNIGGVVKYIKLDKFQFDENHSLEDFENSGDIKEVKLNDIVSYMLTALIPDINKLLPVVTEWNYNEKSHNLPNFVVKQDFANDPNICHPLKNIFRIAGYDIKGIQTKFQECESHPHKIQHYDGFFKKINDKINEYIQNSWGSYKEEYSHVKIEIKDYDSKITINVSDAQNPYAFEVRSEGFKRFISFLLMQAIVLDESKYSDRQNILIIDEPETGLHPSGARDLKNKLKKMAEKNIIVYSTHSPFMMDEKTISNNLIVTKTEEATEVKIIKECGVVGAELVYNAVGFSIYDDLKLENMIFEGRSDKKIIELVVAEAKDWENIGRAFMDGCSEIKNVTNMLDLGARKYIILSDADTDGKAGQKRFKDSSIWYTYKDLGFDHITIEDFIKNDFITKELKSISNIDAVFIEKYTFPIEFDQNIFKNICEPITREIANISFDKMEEIKKILILAYKKECADRNMYKDLVNLVTNGIIPTLKNKLSEKSKKINLETGELNKVLDAFKAKLSI